MATKARSTKAKSSRDKKSARNKRRAGAPPKDYWTHAARPLRLGSERFRVSLLSPNPHGKGEPVVQRITDQVTGFTWEDTSSELTGSLSMTATQVHVAINQSSKIRVEWTPTTGGFEHLWTMGVTEPDKGMVTRAWSMTLSTRLSQARRSRDHYRFRKDKAHPRGWTADQITRFVCEKVGIPVGEVPKGKHLITNLTRKDADPIDMVVLAWRQERRATGGRYMLSFTGKLNITQLRRSAHLLELSGAIIDASYKASFKDTFATVLTVKGSTKVKDDRDKKGKHRKTKMRRKSFYVRVSSAKGVQSYGYVHRTVTAPDADTHAKAAAYGKRVLEKNMVPDRELSVTVPLLPTVRRGDAFRVLWKQEGLTQVVFVSAVTHSVAPGDMTTTLTATFEDPFVDAQAEVDKARRKAAARKRGRKGAEDKAPKGPTSSRGARRRGAH